MTPTDDFRSLSKVSQTTDVIRIDEDEMVDEKYTEDSSCISSNKPRQLGAWSIKHNITHLALSDLLALCQSWMPIDGFPKDPRTLLHTKRIIIPKFTNGGHLYHFGIKSQLLTIIKEIPSLRSGSNISLSFGIDGLPISKSTSLQFWPILCNFFYSSYQHIFIASLFCGTCKPQSLDEFLEEFVDELSEIKTNGISLDSKKLNVNLKFIVADAPARSFIKNVNTHNAYYGCERCHRRGSWRGRVIYPIKDDKELYTDESFKNRVFQKHHRNNVETPLERLGIGMISQIPLDYMHLCCLGTMKKLLQVWVSGPLPHRLGPRTIRSFINLGFARKPRGVDELCHWKATEFRTFLLYLGPMALRKVLSKEKYSHFLLFHTAMYILISPCEDKRWINCAEGLLRKFVQQVPELYYKELLVYNMHSLLHLANEVRFHGPLDSFSAFPFENYMQNLKRMIRSNSNHLSQVVNRVSEMNNFRTLTFRDSNSDLNIRDGSCFLLCDGQIGLVETVQNSMHVRYFLTAVSVKSYPFDSSRLSILFVSNLGESKRLDQSCLVKKCLLLPKKESYYCICLCNS